MGYLVRLLSISADITIDLLDADTNCLLGISGRIDTSFPVLSTLIFGEYLHLQHGKFRLKRANMPFGYNCFLIFCKL
jgi:hypothetical protein